jgi:hypothetical protein
MLFICYCKPLDFQNAYTAITDQDLTEGYVEIIEMGDIADAQWSAVV